MVYLCQTFSYACNLWQKDDILKRLSPLLLGEMRAFSSPDRSFAAPIAAAVVKDKVEATQDGEGYG